MEISDRPTGWMINGPRTLDEQMLGLGPALIETPGKTVLDLGCAEGLIALEFAKAGAKSAHGIEFNDELLELAPVMPPNVTIECADLIEVIARKDRPQYDIVLALAILHKLADPAAGARYCAESARDLIVVRLPIGSTGSFRSKHYKGVRADLPTIMGECGFRRERKEPGPRGEWLHYYRAARR